MTQNGIFKGRTEVRYSYGRFGWTRGGGRTWHGGIDLVGLDGDTIYMPFYTAEDGTQTALSGTVTRARIVTDKSNLTWEWGYYICVQLDAAAPDGTRFLYFCHNSKLLVNAGAKVASGQALAVMGQTGNAAGGYDHCHLEARKTATGTGIDPTHFSGTKNAVGIYGTADEADSAQAAGMQLLSIGPVDNTTAYRIYTLCAALALTESGLYKAAYTDEGKTTQKLTIGPVSSGDAFSVWQLCQKLGVTEKGLYKAKYVEG